jgi:hypothetical protein
MSFSVQHFIDKFEPIPDDKWLTNAYGRTKDGPHCALGHCGEGVEGSRGPNDESTELVDLLYRSLPAYTRVTGGDPYQCGTSVVAINDGEDPRFQQPTPKARVLAALVAVRDGVKL